MCRNHELNYLRKDFPEEEQSPVLECGEIENFWAEESSQLNIDTNLWIS